MRAAFKKIVEFFKKLAWVVCFIPAVMYAMVAAPYYLLGLAWPSVVGERISNDFKDAVNSGDDIKALVIARKYEKWERRFVKKHKLDDTRFVYPGLYSVAYELAGAYQKSLKWKNFRDKYLRVDELLGCLHRGDSVYDEEGVGFGTGTARLHYKMGLRRQAFLEYCKGFRTEDAEKLAEKIEKRCSDVSFTINLVTLTEPEYGSDKPRWYHTLSCFDYPAFLQFMDEEYEKLGRPAEHEYTMKYLHAVWEIEQEREAKRKKSQTRL